MADPFENAAYYSCSDTEILTHESPEEAIVDYFDNINTEDGLEPEAVTVVAYRRMAPTQADLQTLAEDMAEEASHRFSSDWGPSGLGDPDGDDDGFSRAALAEFAAALLPIITEQVRKHGKAWACEEFASREYTANEVDAILRQECPHWFEKEASNA